MPEEISGGRVRTDVLRDRLKELGMSSYRLAMEAGLPNSTVCEIVSGKNANPKILTAKKIVDVLGMGLDDIVQV